MVKPSLILAVNKLAVLGERAGFSIEQMIQLLNAGLSVPNLLELIVSRLAAQEREAIPVFSSPRWIM